MDKNLTELVDLFKDMIRCFDLVIKKEHEGHPYTNEITEHDILEMLDWIFSENYIIKKTKESK